MTDGVGEKAESIFNLMKTMDTLEALPRTGYLLRGVRPCENVAAHCYGTALLAMLLADAETGVDSEKVLRMAILHEAGEAITGDIPRIANKFFPQGSVKSAEQKAAAEVLSDFEKSAPYLELVEEYIEGKTREAKLVRAADKLQMLCKVRFYEQAGSNNLDDFFKNDQGMDLADLPVAQALLSLLRNL